MVEDCPSDDSWELADQAGGWTWRGPAACLSVDRQPWRIRLETAEGTPLTATHHLNDTRSVVNTQPLPTCFVRSAADLHRHLALTLQLAPGERLYGCGESFTRLDKRGQKLLLWTRDAYSVQKQELYKPVPFLLSSRGWGAFVHTGAPLAFDLGHSFDGAATVFTADDLLDVFLFVGSPREMLAEYTALTGRSPAPPEWALGLWMGRTSYETQEEVVRVAEEMTRHEIPCDVIHVDTHWTEIPFRSDFRFSPSRFPDPAGLIERLRELGMRLSLWQFPYLHPKDDLHTEAIEKELVIRTSNGKPPVDDAILDLSNPAAVEWYQERLRRLLGLGVACFTSDFGEAAPLDGVYHPGRSSLEEHNLYPVRYARAVGEATEAAHGWNLQWARAAWAGSQRWPLHFGGDAENTDNGLAATIRAGLSIGLSGFPFWGHFIGGFPEPPEPGLYLRWLAFGALSPFMRCHGQPPREPWEFDREGFLHTFRRIVELRYELRPYLMERARESADSGLPLMRPLFLEFPDDPGCWLVDDAYLLGDELLVAPLLDESGRRLVYLPPGGWSGWFDDERHEGPGWREIPAPELPIVLLRREAASGPR